MFEGDEEVLCLNIGCFCILDMTEAKWKYSQSKKRQKREIGNVRSSPLEVFLGKGVLKICIKFTGENLCQSVILINQTSAWVFFCTFSAHFHNTFL